MGIPALAATNLGCQDINQTNPIEGNWKCPGLGNGVNLDATLSDLDVETGYYTCEYRYPDTQDIATVCTYISIDYKEELDKELASIQKELISIITKKSPSSTNLKKFSPNFHSSTIGSTHLDAFKKDPKNIYEDKQISKLHAEITNALSDGVIQEKKMPNDLNEFYNRANAEKNGAKGYLYNLELTNVTNPKEELKNSYKTFVQPYMPNGGGDERNTSTFSRFVTGLVTLDDEIIIGYNEQDGKPMLAKKWTDAIGTATDLMKELKKSTSADNNNSYTIDTERNSIGTWVDIFGQKIWGFYYNLQRRLDLGYDIISTQLLFIMMVFFSIGMSVRGGARYITNRENGHSSGEVKINEASIMKTLGILAVVFTFYISVPYSSASSSKTDPDGTKYSHFDGNNDMSTNSSLSKVLIRKAMKEGATFGTMISDLGTDAFLRYTVHKQGLNNGLKESDNVIRSIMSMAYYFPAYEIVNECRFQTGLTDDRLFSSSGNMAISADFAKESKSPTANGKYQFYKDNKIIMISDALCRKMVTQTADKLDKISSDMQSLLAMIKKDMFLRMNATSSLVRNHITLQKELGWMNIASIPYTYFMMKHQHLFYETSINYADIKSKSNNYANNIGLRSGQDSIQSTLWMKNITDTQAKLKAAKAAGGHVKEYTRLAVYNFLPGFSSIRNEVLQRIQSLFSDILRMKQKYDKKTAKSSNEYLSVFAERLGEMVATSSKYYGQITDLYDINKLQKELINAAGTGQGTGDPIQLHQLFVKVSYLVAMGIWKSGFILVFLSAIAMIIGLKIVLYVVNVMVHFFISPFIVIWAFATSPDGGAAKIKNYLRDTLIYMTYPTIIVIGVFMFIFAYELFYNIYGFITAMLIEGQTLAVENALAAVNGTPSYKAKDGEMSYLAIYALRDITEILIDLLSVYVAFLTINKFPELVLKMIGVGDSAVIMLPQASETIQSKGGGNVSPLSR